MYSFLIGGGVIWPHLVLYDRPQPLNVMTLNCSILYQSLLVKKILSKKQANFLKEHATQICSFVYIYNTFGPHISNPNKHK